MAAKRAKRAEGPRSLTSIQVDVTNRLGAVAPATTTGIPTLDGLLGGGLRSGTHLLVSGGPGMGKTAFVLMLAYLAARARASVLFSSVGLDETEIMARLTARALHREYQNVSATYGTIWSGQSMQDPALRGPISSCLATVAKKVGEHLYLHAAEPMEDVASLADHAAFLWARNERVVVVVDGAEAYSAGELSGTPGALGTYDARLCLVAYELSRLAAQGCAVITTCSSENANILEPAATVFAELRGNRDTAPKPTKKKGIDSRPLDLVVLKNRLGPTPTVPLTYSAAASVLEERKA
ncbi:MAG TPA: DnaB-like helicase C-terminal domain-containing protein [Polyangiaceae bacterium]|nr:DnaB-like helicase C-terminal domain-containing protein [Polyangiaceae bacterium]